VSHLLASIEGSLTAPVAAANRVFFVEDGVRVRAVLDEALLAESSLEMDGHVASLALPPDFEQSHAVFVGWTEDRPGPSEILSVTRYREVRGILGEGATIVTGLPVPDGGIPLVAIDDQGLVYVALPAATSSIATADAATPRGSILRFDADGRVPAANPRTTPVVAQGYSTPSSLVFDGAGRQLWLAGSDPALASPVSQLPTDFERANEWPRRPMQIPTKDAQLSTPPGLAVLTTGAARHAWWIRRDGGAERGSISSSAGAPFADRRGLGGISHIVAIAPGPSQDVILVTRAGGPSDPISTMWRLVPRSLQP
jgi:hypothetical protein